MRRSTATNGRSASDEIELPPVPSIRWAVQRDATVLLQHLLPVNLGASFVERAGLIEYGGQPGLEPETGLLCAIWSRLMFSVDRQATPLHRLLAASLLLAASAIRGEPSE